jgi:sphinganine-1-phosphate aldolase
MKKYQYFVSADWTGGLYASVSLPGSRVGSQIATTWAALLFNGNANYKAMSRQIKGKTISFAEELREVPNFKVIGWPNVNVVAFYNTKYSIGQLSNYLKRNNWNINILQNPLCLHICITPKNIKYIDLLLDILKKFNNEPILENTDKDITAIYGMAAEIPDKSIIKSLVNYYLDMTTNI